MIVIVNTPFVGTLDGRTFNMPAEGTVLEVSESIGRALLGMNVVHEYEQKIDPLPEVTKKKKRSASSRADPAPRKKTRRSSKRSVTKS